MVRATMIMEQPRPWKWTAVDYYRAANLGWFEGQRVELMEGELIQMPPQSNDHQVAIGLVEEELRRVFGKHYWVRVQMSIIVSEQSEPEPDVAVVSGEPRDYTEKPTSAELVVEVADSTLLLDRMRKSRLYASVMIPEFWIVNLVDRKLEICRKPVGVLNHPEQSSYAETTILGLDDVVVPLNRPRGKIRVADLLP